MAALAERIETPSLQTRSAANDTANNTAIDTLNDVLTTTPAPHSPFVHPTASETRVLRPAVDIAEDAQGVTLSVDLPGVQRENLQIDVQADRLVIDANLTLPLPEQLEARHAEVWLSRYHRAFTLSPDLDTGSIDARLDQGVLTLRIAKAADRQARKVEVRAG